jgi:hypothetical protein
MLPATIIAPQRRFTGFEFELEPVMIMLEAWRNPYGIDIDSRNSWPGDFGFPR